MSFRIRGLAPDAFLPLYGLSDAELAVRGARRVTADRPAAFPDRIEVRDAQPGDTLILLNHAHQPVDTPYRAAHAIFVREGATRALDAVDHVPDALRIRPISLRAFDAGHEMIDADLVDGAGLAAAADRLLDNPDAAYLHAHYAKRGCYAALITRP